MNLYYLNCEIHRLECKKNRSPADCLRLSELLQDAQLAGYQINRDTISGTITVTRGALHE